MRMPRISVNRGLARGAPRVQHAGVRTVEAGRSRLMSASLQPPADPFAAFVPSNDQPFDERWLCHLLRRAAFGVTPERMKKWSGKASADVIDWLLDYDPSEDPFDALVNELEGFVNFTRESSVASYWLYRMLNTPHPLQERIAMFWHGRFATGAGKVGN